MFGDVAVDTQNLESQILSLSSSSGLAATELNEALYSALSAGIPVTEDMSEATGFLESATQLAKAGFTDVDTAISATAKTLNAYGLDVSEADRINKILIQTQNKGITTVGELGASLAQVTPTAAAFGVSFEQVGASLAGMTAAGTPTAQATTQLNSLIAELGKNGTTAANNLQKAAEGTQYAGMSFTEMMESGANLNDVLSLMQDEADKSGLSMVDMFSSIEAGKAALSIFASDFEGNMDAMSTSADVVGDAYAKMADTFETKSEMAKEGITNLGIAVYGSFKDNAKGALDIANSYISELSAAFEEKGATGLVQAAGNVISDVVAKAVEYAPKMIELAIELIQSLITGIEQNLPQIMEGAVLIINQLVTSFLNMLPQLLEMGIQIILQLTLGIAQSLPTLIPAIVETVLTIVETLLDNIDLLVDAAIQLITGLAEGLIAALPILIEKGPEIIVKLVEAFVENAPKLLEAAEEILTQLEKGLQTYLPKLIAAIPGLVTQLVSKFLSMSIKFTEIGAKFISNIKDTLVSRWVTLNKSALELVVSLVNTFLSRAANFIDVGKQYISNIKDAIVSKWEDIKGSAPGLIIALVNVFSNKISEFKDIGSNIVKGIWSGISGGWSWLVDNITGLASNLIKKVKSVLKINSPSKEFEYIGKMCVAGWDNGSEGLFDADDMTRNVKATLGAVQANISGGLESYGASGYTQIVYVNKEIATADELARALRVESKYGMMRGMPIGY